jgi:antitoxin (DNA-binding transcriptional repressor) of toxin-antitoxin stability system
MKIIEITKDGRFYAKIVPHTQDREYLSRVMDVLQRGRSRRDGYEIRVVEQSNGSGQADPSSILKSGLTIPPR